MTLNGGSIAKAKICAKAPHQLQADRQLVGGAILAPVLLGLNSTDRKARTEQDRL
jgi:hypothetical protein